VDIRLIRVISGLFLPRIGKTLIFGSRKAGSPRLTVVLPQSSIITTVALWDLV